MNIFLKAFLWNSDMSTVLSVAVNRRQEVKEADLEEQNKILKKDYAHLLPKVRSNIQIYL